MVAQAQPLSGFFVTDALSALCAAAQLGSLYAAPIVSIGLNLLQFVIDSYIEPARRGLPFPSPLSMVVFAVFLWGGRWGIVGAFIGVPILIASATVCQVSWGPPIVPGLGGWGSMQMKIDG